MIAVRPSLARLVGMVLLLQVVLAPAHCLAMAAAPAGFETVLCSAEGMRSLHLGPDGQEAPAPEAAADFCPACHAAPRGWAPAAPPSATLAWAGAALGWHASAAHLLPPPTRAPPFAPRAPPGHA